MSFDMEYIDKLKAEIKRLQQQNDTSEDKDYPQYELDVACGYDMACDEILKLVDSLQQEQLKDRQIVIITESHGDANIEWDCRSLDDIIALLKSAESFIAEKQTENTAGPGSGHDYATKEGRYSCLFKQQQEQPEVDLEKEITEHAENMPHGEFTHDSECREHEEWAMKEFRHFYELGLKARKV